MLQWGLLLLISGGGIHFSLHHCRKDSISYKTFGPEPENWIPPDADMDLVLADLYVRFKQFCSRHKVTCSCSQFSRTKIHKTRVYEIPLYKCKASKSPVICAWLADICKDFQRAAPIDVKPHADRMAACTWGMAAYFVVVKKKVRFCGDEDATLIYRGGHTFLHLYADSARVWRSGDDAVHLYPLVPKLHQMHHLILDAAQLRENPSRYHCFGPEDRVGKAIQLGTTSHPFTVVETSMHKYRAGLLEDWAKL